MEFPEIRDRIYKYSDRVLLPTLKPHEIKEKYGMKKINSLIIHNKQKKTNKI